MTREMVTRAFGWKSLATAGVLLLTILAGALAARQRGADGGFRGVTMTASQAGLAQGAWLRTVRDGGGGPVLEIRLDDVLAEIGRGVVLDRPALLALVQSVMGSDSGIEDRPVADALGKVTRVRVVAQGMSIVLGRRVVVQTLQHVIGQEAVEGMTIGEVLDAVAGARLTLDGLAGLFDENAAAALLRSAVPAAERGVTRDPQFRRRLVLQRRYAEVVDLVRQLQRVTRAQHRRETLAQVRQGKPVPRVDHNALYAAAHEQLLSTGRMSAVPLLDGYLRLEEELAAAKVGTSSRAERIASRWPARRRAFGDDMADLLFSRDEAMERYEVDRLGLEADPSLAAEEKAQRLRERRQALKVELAARGTFVSFPDETAAAGIPDAAGEGRPQ